MAIFKKEGMKYNNQFYNMVDEGLLLLKSLKFPVDDEKKDSYKNSLLSIIEDIFSVKRHTDKTNKEEEAFYPDNKPVVSENQSITRRRSLQEVKEVQNTSVPRIDNTEVNEPSDKRVLKSSSNTNNKKQTKTGVNTRHKQFSKL